MIRYHAYGLDILSDMIIPEFEFTGPSALKPAQPSEESDTQDVVVRLGAQTKEPESPATEMRDFVFDHTHAVFSIDDVGIFTVNKGQEIDIRPAPGADPRHVRSILIGNVMAAVLYQRGYLVLHASTVQIGRRGVAIVGAPGSGKSSLCLSLYSRGFRVVSDDVSAIDTQGDRPVVMPGYPQLKVSANAALSLGFESRMLIPLHEQEEKRGLRCERGYLPEPVSLDCIYILTSQGAPGVERLSSQEALVELVRHSLPTRIPQTAEASDFLQCVSVVRRVPIYRLLNVPSSSDLIDLAVIIERHQAEVLVQS